jgi:predicted nucleotidyltransferase
MEQPETTQRRFTAALDAFVERAKQEPCLLAIILGGSLSHDRVWEKSDIDLLVIGRDEKDDRTRECKSFSLVENGVNIHATLQSRSQFKRMIEGSLQSTFIHSFFSKSRLLFTRDETIRELYDKVERLGARDREVQLLRAGTGVLPCLYKAQKWFHAKNDLDYTFLWIMHCVSELARIEVFLNHQVAGREVIQQALDLNPKLFQALYTDLINQKKTAKNIGTALDLIDLYLKKKVHVLFQPILDYLAEQGAARSATEIETHFKNQMNLEGVTTACEWLADNEVIAKVSSPTRLFKKGRVQFEEIAFYCQEGQDARIQ